MSKRPHTTGLTFYCKFTSPSCLSLLSLFNEGKSAPQNNIKDHHRTAFPTREPTVSNKAQSKRIFCLHIVSKTDCRQNLGTDKAMSDIDWTKRTCIVHNLSFRMTAQMNVFYNEELCISAILAHKFNTGQHRKNPHFNALYVQMQIIIFSIKTCPDTQMNHICSKLRLQKLPQPLC